MKKVQLNTVKDLEHLKSYYYIQEDGTLYGYRGRKLTDGLGSSGYVQNRLSTDEGQKSFLRHRLVALAFIENTENKAEINHLDEDKTNNHVENLEWSTRAENCQHGTRTERVAQSRSKPVIGTCVKTGEQIEFPSTMEAQRQGFHSGNISSCCNGKLKTYKGHTWQYN